MESQVSREESKLEQQRIAGIVLFVATTTLAGIVLSAIGVIWYKGTINETILSTVGGTLIGVGVIDVFSEIFVRPGVIGYMRKSFPLFTEPSSASKDTLRKQLVRIAGHLSPRKEYKEEFEKFFEDNIAEQFREFLREDFNVSVKLKREKLGEKPVVRVLCEWTYRITNVTDKPTSFPVRFRSDTWSFKNQGLAMKDHIKIEKMLVTRNIKRDQPEDIGQSSGVYTLIPRPKDTVLVELAVDNPPLVHIEPNETITVFVKYMYIGEICDDHTQRMNMLTKNMHLTIDYDENELNVDVDEFAIPKMNTILKGFRYEWMGWLLPSSGFLASWKPKELACVGS